MHYFVVRITLKLSLLGGEFRKFQYRALTQLFYRASASTSLSVIYDDPKISSINDPRVERIEGFTRAVLKASMDPEALLLEFLPSLRHLPSSIGRGQATARLNFEKYSKIFLELFSNVRARVVRRFSSHTVIFTIYSTRTKGTTALALLQLSFGNNNIIIWMT